LAYRPRGSIAIFSIWGGWIFVNSPFGLTAAEQEVSNKEFSYLKENCGIIYDEPRGRIVAEIREVNCILFVGAGASVPLEYQTTDQFITEIKKMNLERAEREIFDFYTTTPDITIEDIIRALDMRINESNNPLLRKEALSPLRTAQISLDSVGENAELKNKLERESTELRNVLEKRLDVYKSLKDRIVSQLYIAYGDKPELAKAWDIYKDYIEILKEQNGRMLPIFTTNYDKVIESLENITESGFNQVITGFKEQKKGIPRNPVWVSEEAFDQEPGEDQLFLFKLHGSLNWRIDIHHQLRELEEGSFHLRGNWIENVLVPPGTVDFQYGEPYQTLRTYLEGYLGKAQTCIVIGYRFDDLTIRDFFVRSLERGIRIIILNPEAEKIKKDKFAQFEKVTCIPKKIEDGAEDLKEALAPSEVEATEPEEDSPPVSESETA